MPIKILLVEDEVPVALDEAQTLEKYGYTVVTSHKGEQAIEQVKSDDDISLVLIDNDLGKGMDGTTAAQEILKQKDLPIVFLTSHAEEEYVDQVKKITNYGYVLKNSGEFVLNESIEMAYRLFDAYHSLKDEKEKSSREERYLRTILQTTVDGFLLLDYEGNIIYANDAYCQMSGYSKEELLHMSINDLDAVESREDTENRIGRIIKNDSETFETKHRRKNGSVFNVEISTTFINIDEGQFVCFFRDITERKRLEKELKTKTEFLETITENMFDLVSLTDLEGNFTFVGKSHEILGYKPAELVGSNVMELVHPEDYPHVENEFKTLLSTKEKKKVEYRYRCADGSYLWLETHGKILTNEKGYPEQIIFSSRDISERKQAEVRLESSEQQIYQSLQNIRFLADAAYTFIDTKEEDDIYDFIGRSLQSLNPHAFITISSIDIEKNVSISKALLGFGTFFKKLSSILGFNPVGKTFKIDTSISGLAGSHDQTIYGLATGNIEVFKGGIHELTFGEVPVSISRNIEKLLKIENIYLIAFIVDKEIYAAASFLFPKGKDIQYKDTVEAFVKQASLALKRRKTEKKLEKSEEKYRVLAENSNDVIAQFDSNMVPLYISPSIKELTGYDPDFFYHNSVFNLVHPDDSERLYRDILYSIKTRKERPRNIFRIYTKNNTMKWVEISGKLLFDSSHSLERILVVGRDITERKKLEEKYKNYIDFAPHGLIITDPYGFIIEVNNSATLITGYSEEELRGMHGSNLLQNSNDERNVERTSEAINQVLNTGYYKEVTPIITKDKKEKTLSISIVKLNDETILSFAEDVTEQKKAEQTIKERNTYLNTILHTSPSPIITHDKDYKIIEWNKGAENLFGYTKKEAVGSGLDSLIASQNDTYYEQAITYTEETQAGNSIPPTETIRYTKDGFPKNVIVAASPIMMDNQFHGSVGTYTDITQLKQKEQQVNNLLQEKEQLLKEVHHRIKNHMNTISAILSLRSSYSDDQKLREVLEEVQDKIRLMQNIYQTLYTGDDVGTIHINSFLQQLLHDIESTYIKKQRIHIVTDIEDIEVTSKQSLPIGIIVTELITNSIKYAFENQEEGNVSISIHRSGENWLNINVADSGEGMPEDVVENESYGFGLTLVKGYVQQFEGKMSIDNTNGTSIRITMELE